MNVGAGLSDIVCNHKNKERMQKVFLILFVGVLGFFISRQTQETPTVNDVILDNVEALAYGEVPGPTICRGSGDVTCPNYGEKVYMIFEGYSLDPDEETY